MSHYTKVKTKLKNKASLIKALQDMGFTKKQLEIHETGKQLTGYQGDKRSQKAEIIIPRRYVGGVSNDIGFAKQADGTYEAIISSYDRGNGASAKAGSKSAGIRGYGDAWLNKLQQRYTYAEVKDQCDEQGLFIQSEEEVDGEILITATTGVF